jgi:DNA-binding NarL/FixJ family response regulator/class 3 adenylate cyclase
MSRDDRRAPMGTVTFVFTDLVGSTELVKQLGDEGYAAILAIHRRIVREAFDGYGGREMDTQGDAFFFAFPRARDAVVAAATAQRAHGRQDWPRAATVRTRMGIHTGEPALGPDGYTGLDVVRAARIAAAGTGGQVLMSDATRAIIDDDLPAGTSLRSLGVVALKGIDRPEPIHELLIGDAPLVAAPAPRLRIALADDGVLLREALAAALERSGFDVVGQAGDVPSLLSLVEEQRPALVVVDVRMPPTHTTEGLQAAQQIRADHPGTSILVLSQYVELRYAIDLLRDDPAGIGYLLKERVMRIEELADAVRRVAAGGSVIDPEVVSRLLGRPREHSPLDELTRREREILTLMAEGRSNHGIAEVLGLEDKTIEGHVGQIFGKLGLEPGTTDHRRVLAVLTFLRDR